MINLNVTEELLGKCNEFFGTDINFKDADFIFDVYETKANFETCLHEEFETLEAAGTAGKINGYYVFLNEGNIGQDFSKW